MRNRFTQHLGALAFIAVAATMPPSARADEAAKPAAAPTRTGGKLLATGGVSQVEGAGGGGLGAWALITGYDTPGQIGANAHYTYVGTNDFRLAAYGAAIGLWDTVELSVAHQAFDTRLLGAALGLGKNYTFNQDIAGVKVRVFGDAVYDQDSWWPQVAVGAQYKRADRSAVLDFLGAKDDHGIDFYVATSKLFLAQSVLVNGTVRFTRANQFGLLGFGGPEGNHYKPEFEGSVALLLRKDVAIGAELRTKPDFLNLGEQQAYDVFLAYFPTKYASLTLAYVDLGKIVVDGRQRGVYASLQLGF